MLKKFLRRTQSLLLVLSLVFSSLCYVTPVYADEGIYTDGDYSDVLPRKFDEDALSRYIKIVNIPDQVFTGYPVTPKLAYSETDGYSNYFQVNESIIDYSLESAENDTPEEIPDYDIGDAVFAPNSINITLFPFSSFTGFPSSSVITILFIVLVSKLILFLKLLS